MTSPVKSRELDELSVARLESRVGRYHLAQRLAMENAGRDTFRRQHLAERISLTRFLDTALSLTGLKGRGRHNALTPGVTANEIVLERLPGAFEGFRILQLTDLHLDMDEDLLEVLLARLDGLGYDLCVLTGDLCERHRPDLLKDALSRLQAVVTTDIWCVLGNHDSITLVPWMEDQGLGVLLNETVHIQRAGDSIVLAGVDDCHYFELANLEKTLADTVDEDTVILLSHSPELFRQAGFAGVDLFLCGHTHGGQICLPGGLPLTLNIDCTRKVGRGAWHYRGMTGYTSTGIGSSMVPVRYNCPPEIVIHRLSSGCD